MCGVAALAFLTVAAGVASPAEAPVMEISNGLVRMKVYPPDAAGGFYRGTRFDWAGVLSDLEYAGHNYYPKWFDHTDQCVRDFVYKGQEIAASLCTAVTGPAEEFRTPLGYDEAKVGGTFVKIGVGVLRKAEDAPYDAFHLYGIADGGQWSVRQSASSVTFEQRLTDPASGYSYVYLKTVALTKGKPQMVLDHSLKNTGKVPIHSTVYNHNFLFLDRRPPGPDFVITFPFAIRTPQPPAMAEVRGNQFHFAKTLSGEERVQSVIEGFGSAAKDYDIRIDNRALGAGVRITADRPVARIFLWSIRAPLAVEPYVKLDVPPGGEFTWKLTYDYYTIPKKPR